MINKTNPFQMVLTPFEQFQNEILFNIPRVRVDDKLNNNYINLVYEANENGGMPDDLEFGTASGTKIEWAKLSVINPSLGDPFAEQVNGKNFYAKIINLANIGVCRLRANKLIAAYIYGNNGLNDSYGYPASLKLNDLSKSDSVCPNPTWTINCTGIIDDGLVIDLPYDYKVRSNLSVVYFHKEQSYNFNFSYNKFFPGEDFKTKWKANVIDPSKDARAVITFSDRSGNDTTIIIEFFAPRYTIRPDFADYGLLEIGDIVDKTFWAINESETSEVLINELKLKFTDQNFEIIGFPIPITISPKDSIPFTVRFTAKDIGKLKFKDSIGIGDTCSFVFIAQVEARLKQQYPLTIEVSDANFGDISVGKTEYKDISIKNTGSTQLIINSFSGPTENIYRTDLPIISDDEPLTIEAGEQYTFTVSFTPNEERSYPDQIVFHSNAKKTDSIAILMGRNKIRITFKFLRLGKKKD